MPSPSPLLLFDPDYKAGIFRGFSEGGLEFHADIVLKYRPDFQSMPMHGQFVLVQLASEAEAVVGRITSMFSDGKLASPSGEDYSIRAVEEDREVPDDLRESYLKYRVNVRVLGVVRVVEGKLEFAASHRRLPHLGAKVGFLPPRVLREVAGHNQSGVDLGYLALGEFIYAADDRRLAREAWMQPIGPDVVVKFDIRTLVSRRSFIFARAGFGKSNLTKLLFSNLYEKTPTTLKRGGREVPVGTIIFDPDGEYFWPDDQNRPGLCDVPALRDQVVVFTRRRAPSEFYQSFVAGDIKLDIRRLRPGDVISIALSPEKQDQQNVRKLKGLNTAAWERLVNEVAQHGNLTDFAIIREILHLTEQSDAEAIAARSNMTQVVQMLHDPSSQMLDMLLRALRDGKLCIIDVSQLRGGPALVLSGLILKTIFDTNQDQFTRAEPRTIPTIAVIEEAQSVLGSGSSGGEGPYVDWVKEGRKYDLGAVMITQQPGSIPSEILSQGDNWFIFHLLSTGDLDALRRANAHFSKDLLSGILNEPIPGHGVFWSSAGGRPYPIPLRALSFEAQTTVQDPTYSGAAIETYASRLRAGFVATLVAAERAAPPAAVGGNGGARGAPADDGVPAVVAGGGEALDGDGSEAPVDVIEVYRRQAIAQFRTDAKTVGWVQSADGAPWMAVQSALAQALPESLNDRDRLAYSLVPRALDEVLGADAWEHYKRPQKSNPAKMTTYVRLRSGS